MHKISSNNLLCNITQFCLNVSKQYVWFKPLICIINIYFKRDNVLLKSPTLNFLTKYFFHKQRHRIVWEKTWMSLNKCPYINCIHVFVNKPSSSKTKHNRMLYYITLINTMKIKKFQHPIVDLLSFIVGYVIYFHTSPTE